MIIYIPVKDLVPELSDSPFLVSRLTQVGLDYATNTIDAISENTYMSIFYFGDYDIKLSNRWVDYNISWGEAGITLYLWSTKDISERKTYQEKITY